MRPLPHKTQHSGWHVTSRTKCTKWMSSQDTKSLNITKWASPKADCLVLVFPSLLLMWDGWQRSGFEQVEERPLPGYAKLFCYREI